MKKLIALIMCICLVVCLSGCDYPPNTSEVNTKNNDNRITLIYNDGFVLIYVDNETGCQYLSKGSNGICLMVDESGNPLIYEMEGATDETTNN